MVDVGIRMKGSYRDQLLRHRRITVAGGWRPNIIVNRCRDLLAAFMKGDSALGIQLLSVGQGDSAWDTQPPPPPAANMQSLVDASPFTILSTDAAFSVEYLDISDAPSPSPTNRLEITVTLAPGSPPIGSGESSYALREFGLFGTVASSNYMIDYVRHPVIHKGPNDTLVRTIRLVF